MPNSSYGLNSTTAVMSSVQSFSSVTATVLNPTALSFAISTTACVINSAKTTASTSYVANSTTSSVLSTSTTVPNTLKSESTSASNNLILKTKYTAPTGFILPKTTVESVIISSNTAVPKTTVCSSKSALNTAQIVVPNCTTSKITSSKNDSVNVSSHITQIPVRNSAATTASSSKNQSVIVSSNTTQVAVPYCGTTTAASPKNEMISVSSQFVSPYCATTTVPTTKSTVAVASNSATNAALEVVEDTYRRLVELDGEELIANADSFECLVCMERCAKGEGAVLRECLHQFCRACLAAAVDASESAEVACPYRDAKYACAERLQVS